MIRETLTWILHVAIIYVAGAMIDRGIDMETYRVGEILRIREGRCECGHIRITAKLTQGGEEWLEAEVIQLVPGYHGKRVLGEKFRFLATGQVGFYGAIESEDADGRI